jgi:phosphopentomutase
VDSDEYGHEGDYRGYVKSLRTYDTDLDTLMNTLDGMGAYGKDTTLIVTTDHSRGEGEGWTSHGSKPDTEKEVFLFVKGPGFAGKGITASQATHASVRPTIEKIFGLRLTGQALPTE